MLIANQSGIVQRVREKYPTPLGFTHAQCLMEIAREIGNGAGLLKKETGTNILLPDGTRVAQDIIVFPDGDGFDILGSGETVATPQWSGPVEGSPFPASRYYEVVSEPAPQPLPEPQPPVPTPIPSPNPQPLSGLEDSDFMVLLKRAMLGVLVPLVQNLQQEVIDLRKELDTLKFEAENRILGPIVFTRKK